MTVNLTFDLADILGADFDYRRTKVWIDTNIDGDVIIDAAGNTIRLGHARATLNADGTGSFTGLPATNGATNPTAFQYEVHVDYPDRDAPSKRGTWASGWFSLTATADLADKAAEAYVAPTWVSGFTTSMEALRDETEAFRDDAAAIVGLPSEDAALDYLLPPKIADPTDPVGAALNLSMVPKWQPLTPYVTGDIRMAPDGSIVKRLVSGTSGSSYTSTNWQTVATVAGTQAKTELDATYGHLDTSGRLAATQAPRSRGALVVAGNKTPTNAAGSAASPGITFRTSYKAVADVTNLRLLFVGWYDNTSHAEAGLAADITYKAAIEYSGTFYPVTFGPNRSVTVNPWGQALSDPISLVIPAGDTFYVRSLVITTGAYPTGVTGTPQATANGFNGYASGDVVDATSAMTTTGTNSLWGPVAIYGDLTGAPKAQIVAVADSITDGTGDDIYATSYNGASSWLTRAMNDQYGLLRLTSPGEKLSHVTGQQAHRRFALIPGCTHSILFSGTNDLWGDNPALSALQSLYLQVATRLKNLGTKVLAPTMLPRTSSTDGWATTGGQSAVQSARETTRTQFNAWLRAGAPIDPTSKAAVAIGTSGALLTGDGAHPLAKYGTAYVIETTDSIETARDSGIWKPGVRTVTDAAITSGLKSLTSATAAFTTAADKGRTVVIQGAGASGGPLVTTITGVVDASTANVATAASTTVSGASLTIGLYTIDGVHPGTDGHKAMAAAFNPALLTI